MAAKKRRPVRMLVYSDTHCGHVAGLTPPGWQQSEGRPWGRNQRALWRWFSDSIQQAGPFDVAVLNGDAIDGPGHKSASSEHVTPVESQQLEMAEEIVRFIAAPRNVVVYGTGYHTGVGNDFEAFLARQVDAEHGASVRLNVNGTAFNFRHHTGRSSVPYGMNAVAKERMWDTLLAMRDGDSTPADVYIRSHVHQFRHYGDGTYLAMTTPALQGPGSKFGRRCSGDYMVGFLVFDIDTDGGYQWRLHRANLPAGPERVALTF